LLTWRIKAPEIAQTLKIIREHQKQGAVLIHCYHGADRTGIMVAMYRIIYHNWTIEQAKKEYKEFFLSDFPENKIQPNLQYPIYLGAGSGAWTKTLFQQADGILQKRYSRMKTKMVGKGVLKLTKSPRKSVKTTQATRKLIMNDESFYEMGKANFIIKEISR